MLMINVIQAVLWCKQMECRQGFYETGLLRGCDMIRFNSQCRKQKQTTQQLTSGLYTDMQNPLMWNKQECVLVQGRAAHSRELMEEMGFEFAAFLK